MPKSGLYRLQEGETVTPSADALRPDLPTGQILDMAQYPDGRYYLDPRRGIPFEELTYEQWSDVVAVNLTGSFLCAQHAFRMMKAQDPQGGRIINNGSVSAHVPRRNSIPYVSTKHALTGLTRSISLDGREYNIACGQIDIGNAATTRNEDTARGRLQASGRVEAEARIDVRDVAKGVLYMAELPPEANVLFMTVMANKMPYVGRG